MLPDIKAVDVAGKRVFVRADLDVPLSENGKWKISKACRFAMENGKLHIEDDARLVAGLPTIQYLLEQGAKVIVGGKLGRPKGKDLKFSIEPVAHWLCQEFRIQSSEFRIGERERFEGWEIGENLFLLENLRFYEGEEKNDSTFVQQLARLADVYVNDAFAMCHRNHASIVGVPKLLPHYAGFRLAKEIEVLSQVLESPKRPLVVIIGGQKIETKLPLIGKMEKFADFILVGGKIAQEAQKLKANLSSKFIVASSNREKTDITEESLNQFLSIIENAKTIVWNGPMGKIQNSEARGPAAPSSHPTSSSANGGLRALDGTPSGRVTPRLSERGTIELAKAIVESGAYMVVGGGDTTEFVKRIGLFDKFDFVSTGGGAMLTFLSGEKLPGLEALIAD